MPPPNALRAFTHTSLPPLQQSPDAADHQNMHPSEATSEEADSASTSKGPHDGDNDVANYFLNK